MIYFLAFLIGVVSGLRSFTGVTAVSWAARLGWLHLEDTRLAFLGFAATPYILTLLAIGELIVDKLPKTPSRTMPPSFIARIVMGSFSGAALGLSGGSLSSALWIAGLLAGALGAVVGTLGGARVRGLLAHAFGKDLPAALLEDLVAIGVAFFAVSR